MLWLWAAIFSYFLFAVVSVADKFLVEKAKLNPLVYAFFVGALGALLFFLAPVFGFLPQEFSSALFALASGASLLFALCFLYKALLRSEPSRVLPAIGGFTPLFSLVFTFLFLGDASWLSPLQLLSLLFLIGGSVLVSWEKGKRIENIQLALLAALFFAFSFVSIGYVFKQESFWIGLLWGRAGGGIAALLLFLASKEVRKAARELFFRKGTAPAWKKQRTALVFFLGQGTGVAGGILQQLALFLAPLSLVAFVAALQGAQYVFLFLLGIFLSFAFPKVLKEKITAAILLQKAGAIALIGLGLFLLMRS